MAWADARECKALAERIGRGLAESVGTQAKLAEASGYDERTIRNVLKARPARPKTIVEICQALGISLDGVGRGQEPESVDVAAEPYGAYARRSVTNYIGCYFGYRRALSVSPEIKRTCYVIDWSEPESRLVFSEYQKCIPADQGSLEPQHEGDIYIGSDTNLIHLMTVFQGAVRLVTLTKMRDQALRGVVLTQGERPAFYQPSVSALLLNKVADQLDVRPFYGRIGTLPPGDPEYELIDARLRKIEAEVIFFAQSQAA